MKQERQARWREKHRLELRKANIQYTSTYRKNNKDQVNLTQRKRRKRKKLKLMRLAKRRAKCHRHKPGYYKQWYQKRIQQGLCTVCNNPAVVTLRTREDKPPVYCELHKERHRLRAYKKRGIFGTTDKQAKIITKNNVLSRMKTELGSKFDEVKDFIESNLDIFKEEFDRPIALSVLLQENYEES